MRKYLFSTLMLICGILFAFPFSPTKECSSTQSWDEITQNWQTNVFANQFSTSMFFLDSGSFPGVGVGAIPDGPGVPSTCGSDGAPLDVTFNVTGLTGAIESVTVDITMTHTWMTDVTATLIAPDGSTSLVLFGRTSTTSATACGDSSDLSGTYIFTDDAVGTNWWAAAIAAGATMPAGEYRTTAIGPQAASNYSPETSLNETFGGIADANGTWTLRFFDGGAGDTGSVSAANLNIVTEEGGGSDDLIIIDLSTENQVKITATTAASAATASGSTFTGFIFENFFANAGMQAIGTTSYVGTPTLAPASVPTDNSPDIFRASNTDNGLNIWNYSGTGTTTFTSGSQAFTGEAIWSITPALYAAMLTAPESGNIYFPADSSDDIPSATLLGTYSVILPGGGGADGGDNCDDFAPTVLTNGTPVTFNGTTVGATASPEETSVLEWAAVWHAVTLTEACNNLTIDYCGTPAGNMSTASIVYTPDCPATSYVIGTYDFVTCGDGNVTLRYTNLPAGTYYLPVYAGGANPLGDYVMNVVSEDCLAAPTNDDCEDAIALECGDSVSGTTSSATDSGGNAANDVFYTYTGSGDAETITVSLCGSSYDTYLRIYSDCSLSTQIAVNDDFCGLQSEVSFVSDGTSTYVIMVEGFSANSGDYVLNLTCSEPPYEPGEPDFPCFDGDGLEGNAENGYNISSATTFRTADDFSVADGTTFSMQQISMSFMSASEIVSVDFNILEDNAGQPGSVSNSITGVVPTELHITGTAFGLNIYWGIFDIAAVELEAGTYWLMPVATNSANTGALYWESTSTGATGSASYRSEDGGATWAVDPDGFDTVFFVAGECEEVDNGCFITGTFDQWPSTTFVPSCIGTAETITTAAWAGEFSKVEVTAGVEYIFTSSVTTDFITIADEDEEIAFATGTGSVTWTSPIDQVIRFYTHVDEDCTIEEVSRTRAVQCGEVPPPPTNDDCDDAIALSCGDSDSGSTIGANDSGGNAAGDVFYSYTGSGAEEMVTVSLCGSSYDTTLRVFTDCSLTEEIASNDDFCGLQSELNFLSDGTSTYYIMVEGFSSSAGNYVINISCTEPPVYDPCAPVHGGVPNSGVGFSNGYMSANDFNVLANTQFNVSTITLDIVTLGGEPTTFDIAFFEGETGVETPFGDTFTGMTPTSMTPNGLLFGVYPIYTVELLLPTTQTFPATVTDDKKYWVGVAAGLDDLGNFTYWVATEYFDTNTLPMWQNDGSTWFVYTDDLGANAEGVMAIEGECEELGVSDMNSFDFTYYPNPVKDYLNIVSQKSVENINVFNLAGQKMMSNVKLEQGKIDMSGLSTGTYVFRITLDGGTVETFKVIKR